MSQPPLVPNNLLNWKRREADRLWDDSKAIESSGASFKSKQKEQAEIKKHLDKIGGVKRDPDRGELTSTEWINKKIKFGSSRPTA